VSPLLSPPRGRGVELLDAPCVDFALARRSLRDVAVANRLFGGTRAVLAELRPLWATLPPQATLLDVGTGTGDIPTRARDRAAAHGVCLRIIGLEATPALAAAGVLGDGAAGVCGDARRLPFADRSVDVVTCSQVLHHFFDDEMQAVLAELHRVARVRVIVSDLERSRVAAAGIWLASFLLAFHPTSRHDGVVSVMRGFRPAELRDLIREAVGCEPLVCRRAGYRVTASWTPA
jgi:SAM-dependent methyltransferase